MIIEKSEDTNQPARVLGVDSYNLYDLSDAIDESGNPIKIRRLSGQYTRNIIQDNIDNSQKQLDYWTECLTQIDSIQKEVNING